MFSSHGLGNCSKLETDAAASSHYRKYMDAGQSAGFREYQRAGLLKAVLSGFPIT